MRALLGRGVGVGVLITGSEPMLGVYKIKMEKTETFLMRQDNRKTQNSFTFFFFFFEKSFASKRLQSLPVKFWTEFCCLKTLDSEVLPLGTAQKACGWVNRLARPTVVHQWLRGFLSRDVASRGDGYYR